jgi:cell division protein FtsI (penicillin-binding protein 3)
LTDPVEPGSVFKPFVMSAALTAGVVHMGEMIDCHDGLFGKRHLQDSHPHGTLTVEQVVAKSSNIGMAVIGLRLGSKLMYEGLRKLGFGQATGVDLPGEGNGLLMPLKKWNSFSTTSVPMGQELAVTPMQIVTAFCALVNGGRLIQPRVIAAITDPAGQVVEDRTAPIEKGQVLEPRIADMMHSILVEVVNDGTGKPAQLDRWQVMGKTGTAQVPRSDRKGYEPDAYLGSFIAAAPASDPAVVVLVMVRKPQKSIGYYGAQVSAPVVKAILQEVLPYLNVPPDKTPATDSKLAMDVHD